jgi:thiol-disulfide isomerase/thioredoxin
MSRMRTSRKSLQIALAVCWLVSLCLVLIPLKARAQLQQPEQQQQQQPVQQQQQQPVIRFVRDPDSAPDLKVKDLDGRELTLQTYKGKVVLLNFWATWCGPCRAEIPGLIRIQEAYKDRLQIIGMDVDDNDAERLRAFVKDKGINYPVAMTSVPVRLAYGGIGSLPTLFVINQEGKMVQKHVGLFDPALYEIEARALLNMPVPARIETVEDTGEVSLKHADSATMLPRHIKTDPRTAHGRIAQAQRGNLRLRMQIHGRAMPHLRSRMQDQQRTRRSHRERSRKITAQGWAWNYRRADFAKIAAALKTPATGVKER